MKSDIIIKQLDNGCFDVHVDDKSTDQLSFDEMLGGVAQLTVPKIKDVFSGLKLRNSMKVLGIEI